MVRQSSNFDDISGDLQRLVRVIWGANGVVSVCDRAYALGASARSRLSSFSDPRKEYVRQLIEKGMDAIMNATRGSLYQYRLSSEAMQVYIRE